MSADREKPEPLEGDELLAAEYALGVLDGAARDSVQARLREDHSFARLVDSWEARLTPMAEGLNPVEPPAEVKARLEARLFGDDASADTARAGGWLSSLAFWHGATGFASAVAIAAFALLATTPDTPEPGPQTVEPGYFAALRAQDASPVVLVRYDPVSGDLLIAGPVEGKTDQPVQPELWVIPPGEGAAPRSLGLIASVTGDLTERVAIDAETGRQIAQGATLAISLEPPGGSPTGAPTGPVIALGAVQSL